MTVPPAVPDEGRITLILTSPRAAAGLLTWAGWERLRTAHTVLAADPEPAWLEAFEAAGVGVLDIGGLPVGQRAGRLVEDAASGRELVWWGSPDGDPGLTDALAEHLSRRAVAGRPPEIEVLTASHDVPGSRLLDLVAVMDTLRSPGGCPWDAEQTHASLLPYLLEETHEVIEAVEALEASAAGPFEDGSAEDGSAEDGSAEDGLTRDGDAREHLVEELGDLLLQVVFHARIGAEHESAPFDIDQVAAGIVAKLIRRHPHVFAASDEPEDFDDPDADRADGERAADGSAAHAGGAVAGSLSDGNRGSEPDGLTASEVALNWEQLKAAEKPRRQGFDGIPATLPALARAQKMLSRLARATSFEQLTAAVETASATDPLAATLLYAVLEAERSGQDAESRLRQALGRLPLP